jgi:hypothetical protein
MAREPWKQGFEERRTVGFAFDFLLKPRSSAESVAQER